MKRIAIILITIAAVLTACSQKDVWLDYDDPSVYIARNGVSFNTAWMYDNDECTVELGVTLSGVRPSNQNSDIEVSFQVDESVISVYNSDITQQYSGQVIMLPADCYQLTGNKVVIPSGEVDNKISIKILTDKVEALGMGPDDIYAIPIKLTSTTKYRLSQNAGQVESIYGVVLDNPRFYFWANRNAGSAPPVLGRKVIFGQTPRVENFMVTSYGLDAKESYTLTFEVDPAMVPAGQQLLPADAYELPVNTVTIPAGSLIADFPVKIINDNVEFRKVFFLPITITAASKYGGDPVKGTLLLRVDVKNDYEWAYVSKISIFAAATGRSSSRQTNKAPTSWDENTLMVPHGYYREHLGTGYYITSGLLFKLKVIPTSDKNRWDVEIINDDNTTVHSSFEQNPDIQSYYDWDNETFYLHYRWLHYGNYIYVDEILEAQF